MVLCLVAYIFTAACALVAYNSSEAYIGAGILALQFGLLSVALTICALMTWAIRWLTPVER